MKRSVLFFGFILPLFVFGQTSKSFRLTGRVVNDNNKGLPYATVKLKTGKAGSITDSSGNFTLDVNQSFPFFLIISSVGYESQELVVKNSNTNNEILALALQYVSYGKRKFLTPLRSKLNTHG